MLPVWLLVVSMLVDVSMLMGIIWSVHLEYGQPAPFYLKIPTFTYIFVFIALRALRFDARFVLCIGVFAAFGWMMLTLYAIWAAGPDAITRSFVDYIAGNAILIGAEVDKIVVILVVTAILALVIRRAGQVLAQARATFEELAERYPKTTQAVSGLTIAADNALAAGTNDVAELLYSRVATLATVGTDKGNAFLQIGRLAKQRGDLTNANAAFDQAIAAAPDSYISARAADLRLGLPPFQRPAVLNFEFDEVQQLADAENWLRTTFNIPAEQASPLWVLSPELEADPRVIRGRELWLVGVNDAAATEFFDVLEQYKTDGLASYRLALFMRGLGAYYPSQVGAANVITAAKISTLQAPAYIARMRYPAYYRDVVLRTSQERDIDPLLLWALIRHESLFDTYATAAAGEKGLTQVIPDTADYIAQQLNWQDYQHADLFRPYAGIAFGAYYLDEQLERFDGYVYAALAGYNAGPGRAITWLEIAGSDPDRFMSTISIASTQLYLQRIYSHYALYRALYGT
ncbi:MAG: lytic transglycosylase domain-containing protein [Anaerolineae bacterium]|nr:lytic transglycosylase domain-containing protein [Anaerolineae bacterium]